MEVWEFTSETAICRRRPGLVDRCRTEWRASRDADFASSGVHMPPFWTLRVGTRLLPKPAGTRLRLLERRVSEFTREQ